MFCRNCGRELESNMQFCPYCATPLDGSKNELFEKDSVTESAGSSDQPVSGMNGGKKKNKKIGKEVLFAFIAAACCLFLVLMTVIFNPIQAYIDHKNADQSDHQYEVVVKNCTWREAFEDAKASGGYLARIDNEEEYDRIVQVMEEQDLKKNALFIGARRHANDEYYQWTDEKNVLIGEELNNGWIISKWNKGEPSYYWKGNPELYVVLDYNESDGVWGLNDVGAGKKQGYICEWNSSSEYENHTKTE